MIFTDRDGQMYLSVHSPEHRFNGSERVVFMPVKEKNGTLICRELKGADGKPMIRDCDGCIADAAAIAEKVLFAE